MKILVLTSVFPNQKQPTLGIFVRERMFKVAQYCDLKVVAPVPWFPFVNLVRNGYRPNVPYLENQDGIEVYHPRFFNIPRYFKFLDGFFFFLSSFVTLWRVRKEFDFDLIDGHFTYPDGMGVVLLGKLFRVPVTITVRGTIRKYSTKKLVRPQIRFTLSQAQKVFTVCEDLKKAALDVGAKQEKTMVVANGVDISKFYVDDKMKMRDELGFDPHQKIIISVGGLTERKGFHRIISILPTLKKQFPDLLYVIVGGASVEGDNEQSLRSLVSQLKLKDHVFFAGMQPHSLLYKYLNTADVFCLSTSNEGWANVFLEAMACGLPVVTTDVGGNPEVVCSEGLGLLVPFGDETALCEALSESLFKDWDRKELVEYAQNNSWKQRIETLLNEFKLLVDS